MPALLSDRSEHIRAWAIQFLCEEGKPAAAVLDQFSEMAKNDPSAVVRLYLASALQRISLRERWRIAEGLLNHSTDRADANLPLMYWYGVEPLVAADAKRALQLAVGCRSPWCGNTSLVELSMMHSRTAKKATSKL